MTDKGQLSALEAMENNDPLEAEDRNDLSASGLSADMIARMGCFSTSATVIEDYTGVKKSGHGYGIPYPGHDDQTGEPYCRYRLRDPHSSMKYVSGLGEDPRLYVPPGFTSLENKDTLIITEGEKKAAKGVQEGLSCVGLQGVWTWMSPAARMIEKRNNQTTTADTPPLDELAALCSHFRRVIILGDSDLLTNPQAKAGLQMLEGSLSRTGVKVVLTYCPPGLAASAGPDGSRIKKQGLDDWLIAEGQTIVKKFFTGLAICEPVFKAGFVQMPMAEHFADRARMSLSYSPGHGWMIFSGTHWVQDSSNQRILKVEAFRKDLSRHAEDLCCLKKKLVTRFRDAGAGEALSPWEEYLDGIIILAFKMASKLGNRRDIETLLVLAQPILAVADNVWDRDRHLLAVENGVVNLKTGDLLPSSWHFYNTQCCTVPYEPSAKHERWSKFLARVQPSVEARSDLQTVAGYLSTGETREQVFFLHYGLGGNGKSTWQQTIKDVLGTYATAASSALVDARADKREAAGALAALEGKRFVVVSELEENTPFATVLVKRLTGEEHVSARRLYCDPMTFKPSCKLVIDTNHLPKVNDDTYSYKRRVRVTKWTQTISQQELDAGGRQLRQRLQDELPGILAWIVEGAVNYYKNGLGGSVELNQGPENCLVAAADELADFLTTRLQSDVSGCIQSSTLFAMYKLFLRENGSSTLVSTQAFSRDLRSRGYTCQKNPQGNMVWRGLCAPLREQDLRANSITNAEGSTGIVEQEGDGL